MLRAALVLLLLAPLSLAPPSLAQSVLKQDIFTTAPFASCHASTIVELHDGSLLAAWFGGSGEGEPDVALWSARRTTAGWTAPTLLARLPDVPLWNPVLFHTSDGRLWLYYKAGPVVSDWTGARLVSTDEGQTWSAPAYLPAGMLGPTRTKPFVGPHHLVLSGSSTESYHRWAAWIERSTDDGQTYTRIGPYTLPDQAILVLATSPSNPAARSDASSIGKTGFDRTTGLIQPTILSLGRHHLRFYARGSSNISRICVSDSFDNGKSWSTPRALDLPNPNSGIDLVRLRDGRIVLIYNPTIDARSPLALAISRDGEHFRHFATLEDDPDQEFSYPALIQLANGNLAATYTWHRTRIRYASIPLAAIPQS